MWIVERCECWPIARTFLIVPSTKEIMARQLGAQYDKVKKEWYVLKDHKNAGLLQEKFGYHTRYLKKIDNNISSFSNNLYV